MAVAVSIQRSDQERTSQQQHSFSVYVMGVMRLWWHVKAYVFALGLLILLAASLIVVRSHWLLCQVFGSINSHKKRLR